MTSSTILGRAAFVAGAAFVLSATTALAQPSNPECIAPAQPGGGFDITCKLAQAALKDAGILEAPLRVSYMPGGIGAVAYNTIVGQRPAEAGTIVAFSAGSLLNLAQGKFGAYDESNVRWVAAVGTDYGAVVVQANSPWNSLTEMMDAIKADPSKVILGAGGTIGSQDWMKAALTAQAAGIDHKSMRFVAFEGGGDCATALQGGHVQACMQDVGDSQAAIDGGAPLKQLAVFSDARLEGKLANIPTAKEQGYDINWPVVRGFYVGPEVSDADYQWWVDAFSKAMAAPTYNDLVASRNLLPLPLVGAELDAFVKEATADYRKMAADFELVAK